MDESRKTPVYELWSDEELRWIEVEHNGHPQLLMFLDAWCEKNQTIFRRRWKRRSYENPRDEQPS